MTAAPHTPARQVMVLGPILRALPDERSGSTCLYFVQEDGAEGHIKIGHTNNPEARLRALQNGNPRRVRVLGMFRVRPFAETDVHTMLRARGCHVRGEWFQPHPHIFDLIDMYEGAGLAWE